MPPSRPLNVAVTGNPPFREYDFNTSQLVRDALPDTITREGHPDIRVLKYARDTRDIYEDVRRVSREIWGGSRSLFLPEPQPGEEDEFHVEIDFILHLGMISLGGDPTQFRFETVARRDGYELPGDDGKLVDSNQLKALGLPETLVTSFDVEGAWRKVEQGHPEVTCCVSNDAGLYYCEFRLYSSLAEPLLTESCHEKEGRVLFLHLPQAHDSEAIRLARDVTVSYITALTDDPILSRLDLGS
ncbi:pyroglutamyl-peptidase [Apiospora marii]|uniref:Pyroglutamyl-peptidase n=1 Tax=Apiospora marii TaxID=335849 RepID=A0ABR1RAN6_9PEZI